MRPRLLITTMAAFGLLAAGLWPTIGTAQILRRPALYPPVVVSPPTAPVPVVTDPAPLPTAAQPAPPNPPAAPIAEGRQPEPSQVPGQAAALETQAQARIMRGSQLMGLRVWGHDNQPLGTIKDFIVDYQGGCPTLFFAMAPEVADLGREYVIVPFTAMSYDVDPRTRANFFRFDVSVAQLRNAPHIEVDNWTSIHNRQFLTNAQQFYQRIERTAARPEFGEPREHGVERDGGRHQEPGMRPEHEPRPEAGTRPDAGTQPMPRPHPDTGTRPDTGKPLAPGSQPGAGITPDTAKKPDHGIQPGAGSVPDTSKKPDQGSQPGAGSVPDTSKKPDQGSQPGAGSVPDTSKKPDHGIQPGAGSVPDTSKKPATGIQPSAGSPSGSLPNARGTEEKDQPQPPVRR